MDNLTIKTSKIEFEQTVLNALQKFKEDTGFEISDIQIGRSLLVSYNKKGCMQQELKRELHLKIHI